MNISLKHIMLKCIDQMFNNKIQSFLNHNVNDLRAFSGMFAAVEDQALPRNPIIQKIFAVSMRHCLGIFGVCRVTYFKD